FQLADDLLDVEGDTSLLGKAIGKDRGAGKATLVAAFGVQKARTLLADLEEEAVSRLKPFGERAATLIEAARFVTRRRH
ncbi:MAG: polyprenyl synthetase family protein, partial [Hyphomicrobiales bacterium]